MSARRLAWSPRSRSLGQPDSSPAHLRQCALALGGLPPAPLREPYRGHDLRPQVLPRIRLRPVAGLKEVLVIGLADEIDAAIAEAVKALRGRDYSWAEIGSRLGISRQAAQQRWGSSS